MIGLLVKRNRNRNLVMQCITPWYLSFKTRQYYRYAVCRYMFKLWVKQLRVSKGRRLADAAARQHNVAVLLRCSLKKWKDYERRRKDDAVQRQEAIIFYELTCMRRIFSAWRVEINKIRFMNQAVVRFRFRKRYVQVRIFGNFRINITILRCTALLRILEYLSYTHANEE